MNPASECVFVCVRIFLPLVSKTEQETHELVEYFQLQFQKGQDAVQDVNKSRMQWSRPEKAQCCSSGASKWANIFNGIMQ